MLKLTYVDGVGYYDVLCSFPMRSARNAGGSDTARHRESRRRSSTPDVAHALKMTKYTIKARVEPPHSLARRCRARH